MHILSLPESVIQHVFSYVWKVSAVPHLSRTCKSFHSLTKSRHLSLDPIVPKTLSQFSSIISSRSLQVVDLSFTDFSEPVDGRVFDLIARCSSLRRLRFDSSNKLPTNEEGIECSIRNLFISCSSLEELAVVSEVQSVFLLNVPEEHSSSSACSSCPPHVQTQKLQKFSGLGVHMASTLRHLELRIDRLDDLHFAFVTATSWPKLQHLVIQSSRLTDSSIALFAPAFPSLVSLDISGCERVTGVGFSSLAFCKRLVRLIANGTNVNSDGLKNIASSCPQLQELSLRASASPLPINDSALECLGRSCSQLRSLALRDVQGFSEASLLLVAKYFSLLTHLDMYQVNDAMIKRIDFGHCFPHLKSVCFSWAPLTIVGLEHLVRTCPQLTKLDLSAVNINEDRGILAVADHCRNLRSVSFSGFNITTQALLSFISSPSCKHMSDLDISHCQAVTDEVLIRISECCQDLEKLNCSRCEYVTERGINAVLSKCESLSSLSYIGTSVSESFRIKTRMNPTMRVS